MKKIIVTALILGAAVTVIPVIPAHMARDKNNSTAAQFSADNSAADAMVHIRTEKNADAEPYEVFNIESGEVLKVPVRDYVIGAVCAEMPASFEVEALKAQAVAAHTYAERQRLREKESPTPELCGADFSNDTSKYQGFFTIEQAKEHMGDKFADSYEKIANAVDEVLPYIITYDDTPIIAAFHSMSSGFTESAENAWGSPVEYLVEVDSRSDLTAPKFREDKRFTEEEMKAALETAFPGVTLGEAPSEWIVPLTISDAGTVLTANVGDKTFRHGVGMSQYGANAMAADGKTWREILEHYYPSCSISIG